MEENRQITITLTPKQAALFDKYLAKEKPGHWTPEEYAASCVLDVLNYYEEQSRIPD